MNKKLLALFLLLACANGVNANNKFEEAVTQANVPLVEDLLPDQTRGQIEAAKVNAGRLFMSSATNPYWNERYGQILQLLDDALAEEIR
jgi:hypothetical protein